MTSFQIEIEIDASPDRVWGVMRDVQRWPEWTPSVTSVRLMNGGPLAIGTRAVVRQPKLPPALWRVTELDDAGRSFTWVSTAPGVRVIAKHSVATLGQKSRAALSLHFEGLLAPLLVKATRKLNDRYLALEANGLKSRAEERDAS
jgi:hypothetical protein